MLVKISMETLSNPDLLSGEILSLDTTIRLPAHDDEENSVQGTNMDDEIVNANEPDIFSMVSFKQLILESRQEKRDFILAKVVSDTPANNNASHSLNTNANNREEFHYFYHAPELNKVLFKFESERRLLHRMKVRNPLNNVYIIGKVFYYKLTPTYIDQVVIEKLNELSINLVDHSNKESDVDTGNKTDQNDTNNIENKIENSEINNQKSENNEKIENSEINDEKIENNEINNEKIEKQISVGSLLKPDKQATEQFPSNSTIEYKAEYICSDDDFLTKARIREYFRKNSPEGEEFIFELDRRNNDLIALLETGTPSEDDASGFWKRLFSFHITLLMGMMIILLLLGSNPLVIFVVFPVAVFVLVSFLCTICYLVCIRRTTFDSLAVENVENI